MLLVTNAFDIAIAAHDGQFRKYSGEPYIVHPISVALRANHYMLEPEEVAAAYLHDVLEDCGEAWADVIGTKCNSETLSIVRELTKPSKLPEHAKKLRQDRHAIDMKHYENMSAAAQRLKMIDRIDNLEDMTRWVDMVGTNFAKKYVSESCDIFRALRFTNCVIASDLYRAICRLEAQFRENP